MPLRLPNLDDRSYGDLMAEARALIPAYAPQWTNHNPSDPGITLVELFVYLAELLIYRVNRVTDANVLAFLRLLNGPAWVPTTGRSLDEEVREAVLALRRPHRAVTAADFELLAREADPRVVRVHCLPRRDLEVENVLEQAVDEPGHVSVVIVPAGEGSTPSPAADLKDSVAAYLDLRRLLTTQMHVVGPRYLGVGVRLTLVAKPDAVEATLRSQAVGALREFLNPLTGGVEHVGWPFGRDVYASEIYELLDRLDGVDYVTRTLDPDTERPLDELVVASGDTGRLRRNARGDLEAIELRPAELVDPQVVEADIGIVSPITVQS